MNKLVKIFALMLVLFAGGCAYFNTFYNAIQFFEEAEQEIVTASNSEQLSNKKRGIVAKKQLLVAIWLSQNIQNQDSMMMRSYYAQKHFIIRENSSYQRDLLIA